MNQDSNQNHFEQLIDSIQNISNYVTDIIDQANKYSNEEDIYQMIQIYTDVESCIPFWIARYKYALRQRKLFKAVCLLKKAKSIQSFKTAENQLIQKQIEEFIKNLKKEIINFGCEQGAINTLDDDEFKYLKNTQRHSYRIFRNSKIYIDHEFRCNDRLFTYCLQFEYGCQNLKQYQIKQFQKEQRNKKSINIPQFKQAQIYKSTINEYDRMQLTFERYVRKCRQIEINRLSQLKQNIQINSSDSEYYIKQFVNGFKNQIKQNAQQNPLIYFMNSNEKQYFETIINPFQQIQTNKCQQVEANETNQNDIAILIDNSSFKEGDKSLLNESELSNQMHQLICQQQDQNMRKDQNNTINKSNLLSDSSNNKDSSLQRMLIEYQNKQCDEYDLMNILDKQIDQQQQVYLLKKQKSNLNDSKYQKKNIR